MTGEKPYDEGVSTGCSSLDRLLNGGFSRREVSQIYGPPASGKTNICLQTSVEVARDGGEAVFVDTEGVSPERFRQIAPDEETARRIRLKEVYDFDEQEQAVADVENVVEAVDLVVVDSATGLYRVEEDASSRRSGDGDDSPLQRLSRQIVHLTSLARRYDVAVVVTNQVYTDPDMEEYRALGGNAMEHWTKTILRLERLDAGRRRAVVEKSQSSAEDRAAEFRITASGVEPPEDDGDDPPGDGAAAENQDAGGERVEPSDEDTSPGAEGEGFGVSGDDENKTNNTSV